MADEKALHGVWTETLLDRIHDRMVEMVGFIAGQKMGRQPLGFERTTIGTVLDQGSDRRGHQYTHLFDPGQQIGAQNC